ncbi:MAG: hypothetical protein ACK2T3_05480, partial [Candidatus Promineifilaceae bacterium]
LLSLIALPLFLGVSTAAASFQEPSSMKLILKRDMGFGLGGQIQGRFSLKVEGPSNLEQVLFYIDDALLGKDSSEPFGITFNTSEFDKGVHRLYAVGTTSDGRDLMSNQITREFASMQSVGLIVAGIIVLAVGFRVVSYFITREKGPTLAAQFGMLGGTVCPNCGKPYGIHWWSLRLGFSRLDRCPHCGKWKMVSRASAEQLEEAALLLQDAQPGDLRSAAEQSDEEKLQQLDDSRYSDY